MKRKSLIFIVLFSIFSLAVMTVVYALLSQTLTITGSSEVVAASWDIKFDNLNIEKTGEATFVRPTISNTSLTNFGVDLMFGGDSVTFYVDVVNDGTVDARLDSIVVGEPVCSETSREKAGFRDGPCDEYDAFFEHKLTYDDGSVISKGDLLNVGESKTLKYTLKFTEDGYNYFYRELLGYTISFDNFNVTLLYVQN